MPEDTLQEICLSIEGVEVRGKFAVDGDYLTAITDFGARSVRIGRYENARAKATDLLSDLYRDRDQNEPRLRARWAMMISQHLKAHADRCLKAAELEVATIGADALRQIAAEHLKLAAELERRAQELQGADRNRDQMLDDPMQP